ncbi:hypothetical protein JM16_009531 [Phytophthora kernoviae]|uniref:TauD/TfdA-like domain-containing protein n=1 Tax=Phytophthora kernoviae TaxID=325452 RepID=A0A8T0LIB5_9STRA|nr:hypothetical protein JM16_009531 [Phytophthora kernoviae]
MATVIGVKTTPEQLELKWSTGKTSSLLHVWLRDNCRCSICYHAVAEERILDSSSISLDIQPKSVTLNSAQEVVEVGWATEDARNYNYAFDFLEQYSGLANGSGETGVPYGRKRVEEVGRRISIIRNSFWGESSWDVKDIPDPTSLSLTGGAFFPHTDLCFSDSQPGIQFLHCLEFSADKIKGGESTIVDGCFVAEKIRHDNPEAFKVLSTQSIAHVFSSKKHHFRFDGPVIRLDPADGSVKELRYNQTLIAPLNHASKELYAALQLFARETRSLENLLHFRLKEGDMLVFNNCRMMHGRMTYNAVNTCRHLEGCYLDFKEFQGRLKKLRENSAAAA